MDYSLVARVKYKQEYDDSEYQDTIYISEYDLYEFIQQQLEKESKGSTLKDFELFALTKVF